MKRLLNRAFTPARHATTLAMKSCKKTLSLCLMLLSAQLSYSNESSTQWFIQPLKIKHQVGKDVMTEAALYRFPVFMFSTQMTGTLNNITAANRLEELTAVKERAVLADVNLASLYGISVFYNIAEDVTRIDLTKARKPAGESIPLDDVIAMTLECVRLTGANDHTFILTNEETKKWKDVEKALQDRTLEVPMFSAKTVPLAVADTDLLYHWAYWPGTLSEEQSEPTRFPTHGGKQAGNAGTTSYQGIGFSYPLSCYYPNSDETRFEEINPLAGYSFQNQDGFIVIQSPAPSPPKQKDAFVLMKQAVECLALSVQANGEKDVYRLKISDPSLTKDQCVQLIKLW